MKIKVEGDEAARENGGPSVPNRDGGFMSLVGVGGSLHGLDTDRRVHRMGSEMQHKASLGRQ